MLTAQERANRTADVVAALRDARRVTAICHENPDADTIGAAVAITLIARQLGKSAELVSHDAIPSLYNFLPAVPDARHHPSLEPDLAVICDAANLERVGSIATEHAEWFRRARVVNIDHHISNTGFGDLNLVEPDAAATCQVLMPVVSELKVNLTPEIATALLTGIVRDSQGFSDPATTAETLRIAADLVTAGASLSDIHRRVLQELPHTTIVLWGHLLARIQSAAEGRIVWTVLTPAMLDQSGTGQHDADGVAEFLGRIRGAHVAILFREIHENLVRVSVRTLAPEIDATLIMHTFGGGGHARRAGGLIPKPLAEAVDAVLDVTASLLDAHHAADV